MNEKANWLEVNVTYFKPSGKYYSDTKFLLPNDISFYERRERLTVMIEETFPNSYFTFVSLDSPILGYPYMKVGDDDE